MPTSLRRILPWALPLLLAIAAYANSFSAGLVYDNWGIILHPPAMRDRSALAQILTTDWWFAGSDLYRPITTLSLWLDTAFISPLFSASPYPAWYHLINLLLHLANVALLFALARRACRSELLATLIATLWAVHPVNTEAVTNIIGRADELAALGVLAALLLYVKSQESRGRKRTLRLLAASTFALVGMLSKENAIVLPALAVAWDLRLLRLPISRRALRNFLRGWLILTIPALLTLALRLAVLPAQSPVAPDPLQNPIPFLGPLTRLFTSLGVLGNYVTQTFLPAQLSCDYSVPATAIGLAGLGSIAAIAGLVMLLALAIFAVIAFRRGDRSPAFFLAFFFIAIAPVSNFIVPIGTIRGDRLMYLPMIGLLAAALTTVATQVRVRLLTFAVAGLALTLGLRTFQRNFDWRTDATLWRSAVLADPANPKAHDQYAWALNDAAAGQPDPPLDEMIAHSQIAADLQAGLPEAWRSPTPATNLGIFLARKADLFPAERDADLARSLQSLEAAFRIAQTAAARRGLAAEDLIPATTALNLGAIRLRLGNRPAAAEAFELMRRTGPAKIETWATLANFHAQAADWPAAARAAWCALLLDPRAANSRQLLARIYTYRDASAIGPAGPNFGNATVQTDLRAAGVELIDLMARRHVDRRQVTRQLQAWGQVKE